MKNLFVLWPLEFPGRGDLVGHVFAVPALLTEKGLCHDIGGCMPETHRSLHGKRHETRKFFVRGPWRNESLPLLLCCKCCFFFAVDVRFHSRSTVEMSTVETADWSILISFGMFIGRC